jgi:hypothetical protein
VVVDWLFTVTRISWPSLRAKEAAGTAASKAASRVAGVCF